MLKPPLPLTALSEAQRAQAQERFEIIRPALEEGVTQAQVARIHKIPASTVQSWIKRYRDKGKSRRLPTDAVGLIETKSYRRFGEMCDACRRAHVVGLGYGPPGTGKTDSAKQYAQWSLFRPFLPESLITFTGRSAMDGMYPYRPFTFASAPLEASAQECRAVFYTPPVSASVAQLEKEVLPLFAAFSYLVEAATQGHQGREEFLVTRRFSHLIELLIVNEAN